MKRAKNKTFNIITAIILIVIICLVIMLFFSVPSGDALKNAMAKDDFVTVTDITNSTPILGLMLPEGANRSLTFTKNVNLSFDTVIVIYFDDYKSLFKFKEDKESNDGQVILSRGKAVFMGSTEATTSARWKVWAFNA